MGVIDPEAADKTTDAPTRSMRHSSVIGMRLWKMWREAESQVSVVLFSFTQLIFKHLFCRLIILRP